MRVLLYIAFVLGFMSVDARNYKILVLPCGGATGIISARLLQEVEEKTQTPFPCLFDEIWGCSAGSIIASLAAGKKKSAREIVGHFSEWFSSYRKAYRIRNWVASILGTDLKLRDTICPVRILTAASYTKNPDHWSLYGFSSDGISGCGNTQLPLADVVTASCTVYPYLFPFPTTLTDENHKKVYAIDSGSLCPGITDPTAYFLAHLLENLHENDTATIFFVANAFTQSCDQEAILRILTEYQKLPVTSFCFNEGSFNGTITKQITIVNIPILENPLAAIKRYMKKTSLKERAQITILKTIFDQVVGSENAAANLLAAGVIPIDELITVAENVIHSSQNFKQMINYL